VEGGMNASLAAKLQCADCGAPMDKVETVAVLASLAGHSIFECEWCGHIAVEFSDKPSRGASWIASLPADCRVSYRA